MWIYPIVVLPLVIAVFIYVATRSFLYAVQEGVPPNTHRLALALGWVSIIFVAIALQGFGHQAVERGWFPLSFRRWMFSWGVSIIATAAFYAAVVCLRLVSGVFAKVQRDEKLVSVMITSPVVDVKTSELSLTARELEVLEAMAQGHLSDEEIAEAFYISPATAATHVRNILRKADIHNRRDLVLMYSATHRALEPESGPHASST